MLPPLRQRLLITAAILVGGLVWMQVEPWLLAPSGAGGVTLIDAAVGPIAGWIVALLGGAVAIGLAILLGAMGNPLASAFVFAGSLCFLAADGGSSLPFLWRSGPGDYMPLLIETIAWFALLFATLWLSDALRFPLRRRVRGLADDARPDRPLVWGPRRWRGLADPPSLLGVVVCAAVAGVLAHLMIRSWDIGQVLGTLVFAFAVGGLIAQMVVPAASPGLMLFSPLLLAAYGYLQTWLMIPDHDALLAAAYRADGSFADLSGLAWTLPIHFASAAVAGCVLGAGMAQGLLRAEKRPWPSPRDATTTPAA